LASSLKEGDIYARIAGKSFRTKKESEKKIKYGKNMCMENKPTSRHQGRQGKVPEVSRGSQIGISLSMMP
jgi:hypothetical protein